MNKQQRAAPEAKPRGEAARSKRMLALYEIPTPSARNPRELLLPISKQPAAGAASGSATASESGDSSFANTTDSLVKALLVPCQYDMGKPSDINSSSRAERRRPVNAGVTMRQKKARALGIHAANRRYMEQKKITRNTLSWDQPQGGVGAVKRFRAMLARHHRLHQK